MEVHRVRPYPFAAFIERNADFVARVVDEARAGAVRWAPMPCWCRRAFRAV
jgi:hypothetical protein